MTSRSRSVLAAVAALSGLALAGCASSSTPPATSGPSGSAASSAAATPSATSPAGSVTPGGPMATASGWGGGRPDCTAAQLKIAYTDNAQIRNGALDGMSHADSVITFTNVSSSTCQIRGYPGVAALDSSGHQIKQAVRGNAATGRTPLIVLAPGQVASAEITGNTASCTSITKVAAFLITAPDQRTSTRLAGAHQLCLNSLGIDPLQPGNAAGLPL